MVEDATQIAEVIKEREKEDEEKDKETQARLDDYELWRQQTPRMKSARGRVMEAILALGETSNTIFKYFLCISGRSSALLDFHLYNV